MVQERLDQAVVAGDRVVEVEAGLPERPKPGRSGATPPARSRNGSPESASVGHAVQVEDRRAAGVPLGPPPERLDARDLLPVLGPSAVIACRKMAWKPPPPKPAAHDPRAPGRRVRPPVGRPHRAPIDELVLTVLSQNTNDRNRDVAYERLRDRFESWDEVREAPVDEVEEAIRPGGLAVTKAPRIQEILRAIGDDDLSRLARRAARAGARGAVRAARRGPQDRRLRAAVLLRPPRRARWTPTCTAWASRLGLFRPKALARGGARRDAPAARPAPTPTRRTSR